jgi:hypothetical protein
MTAIPPPQTIDLAGQTQGGTVQFDADALAVLVGFEGSVQLPASVDGSVRNAEFFYLFEVE